MTNAMAANFQLTSKAFKNENTIPSEYTCDGKDISPPLEWTDAPAASESFALICADPDAPAGTWYHWVVFNIPKTATSLSENQIPEKSVVGLNSWKRNQYNGPCPPPGKPHRYIFTLYALDTQLNLPETTDAGTLEEAMKGHLLQSAVIIGLFGR